MSDDGIEETMKIMIGEIKGHATASATRHEAVIEKLDKHEELLFGSGSDDLGMRGRVATLWRENRQRNKWMLGAVGAVVILVAKDAWMWITSRGGA